MTVTMARLTARNVSLDFPVYSMSSRSLKKRLVRLGTGGRLVQDAKDHIIVRALQDVSVNLNDGDRLALVGRNGAGKTSLLLTLAGIYEPTAGLVDSEGDIASLIDISQAGDPEGTGYENIRLRGLMMGLDRPDIDALTQEVEDFTELGEYLAMPIRTYSSGMMMRLFFGVATSVKPDILLMDEWLSAGDASFMQKARRRLDALVGRSKILVLASHSEDLLRQTCNRAILLDRGQLTADASLDAVLERYRETQERPAAK